MTKMSPANDSKPDNYQINAKICCQVERYPCMYDRSHVHYLKKDVVDKAWIKIAKEMDDSIPSCKERWRNIRTSFARSINVNKVPASANRTKPYYLHEELKFLAKHITPGIPIPRRSNVSNYYSASEESETIEVAVGEESFDGFVASVQDEELSQGQESNSSLDESHEMLLSNNNNNTNVDEKAQILKQAEAESAQMPQIQEEKEEEDEEDDKSISAQHQLQQQDEQQKQQVPQIILPEQHVPTQPVVVNTYVTPLGPPKKRQRIHEYYATEPEYVPEREREHDRADVKPVDLPQESDFDALFLQGLLPEMKAMDFHQKLSFKRRIYEVIGEIFDNTSAAGAAAARQHSKNTQPLPLASTPITAPAQPLPTMAVVNAADLAMIRRLNTLLQSPASVGSSSTMAAIPKNVASITSTVRSTPPPTTATVAVHRGALTRAGSNLLRVTMVNPPISSTLLPQTQASSSAQVKQEPEILDN